MLWGLLSFLRVEFWKSAKPAPGGNTQVSLGCHLFLFFTRVLFELYQQSQCTIIRPSVAASLVIATLEDALQGHLFCCVPICVTCCANLLRLVTSSEYVRCNSPAFVTNLERGTGSITRVAQHTRPQAVA